MDIRQIGPHDYADLMALKLVSIPSCSTHYTDSELRTWINYCKEQSLQDAFGDSQGFIIEQDQQPVGYITFSPQNLDNIFISPGYQGKQLGDQLINKFHEQLAPGTKTRVRATLNAVNFYKKHGYQFIKEGISRAGFNMIVMERTA